MEATVIDMLEILIQNHRELEAHQIDDELRYAIELLQLDEED